MIRLINWKEVQASNFEKFIYHSLGFEGFKKREWFGRGGSDRGRDVVATFRLYELIFPIIKEADTIPSRIEWAIRKTSS